MPKISEFLSTMEIFSIEKVILMRIGGMSEIIFLSILKNSTLSIRLLFLIIAKAFSAQLQYQITYFRNTYIP